MTVWELPSGRELARFDRPHSDDISDISFSPDGTVLATASWDNTCKLFDLKLRQQITTLRGQKFALHSVCFSPDGRRLAAGTGDGSIVIWDLETEREVLVLRAQAGPFNRVLSVGFHPSGDSLLSMDETALRVWRTPSFAEIEAAERERASLQVATAPQ